MADIEKLLQKIIEKQQALETAFTVTHNTSKYADLLGPPDKAVNTLAAMKLLPGQVSAAPGWLDDVANAIESEEAVLRSTDELTGERIQAEWYKVGRQSTVTNTLADILDLPIRTLNAAIAEYDIAGARAEENLDGIKKRNPTDMLSAMQYKIGEIQTYNALKELIDPAPAGPSGKVIVKKGRRGSKAYIIYGSVPSFAYT